MHFDIYTVEGMKNELVETIRFLHSQGWAPATSSNYSFRVPDDNIFFISQSGVDKGAFTADHLMLIDAEARPLEEPPRKPSAETLLHTLLYEDPKVGAVLHTHSVNNTVLSVAHAAQGGLRLEGFEVLKGLKGIETHEAGTWVPIFANTQDMEALSEEVRAYMKRNPDIHGFLLAGHGLYTWGSTIAETRRHVEVFEFLFDCTIKLKLYGNPDNSR